MGSRFCFYSSSRLLVLLAYGDSFFVLFVFQEEFHPKCINGHISIRSFSICQSFIIMFVLVSDIGSLFCSKGHCLPNRQQEVPPYWLLPLGLMHSIHPFVQTPEVRTRKLAMLRLCQMCGNVDLI